MIPLTSTISAREWRRVALFALAVTLLTTIPYLVALAAQTEQARFGGSVFGVDDIDTYLAKMRQGANGEWLFRLRYTSETHTPAPIILPYITLGHIAGLFAPPGPARVDTLALVYHAARLVFGVALILVYYRFAAIFLRARRARWLALILMTLGGGLGWLQALAGLAEAPGFRAIDLFVPEGFTFYLLYGLPHLALGRLGLFGGLLLFLRGAWRSAVLAGLCWLVMALAVPFYVGVLGAVLGVWGLAIWLRTRRFPLALLGRGLAAGAPGAVYLALSTLAVNADPVLRVFQAQNYLPSPHPLQFLVSYGPYLLLALPALGWAWRRGAREPVFMLLPIWPVTGFALAYVPLEVQRRFIEGAFMPLCVLAAAGLWLGPFAWLRRKVNTRAYRFSARLLPVVGGVASLTLALTLVMGVFAALSADPATRLFHPVDELAALDWLDATAQPDSVILVQNAATASYLPARTDLRVYYGHGVETVHSARKWDEATRFFAGEMTPDEARRLLADGQVAYVVAGPDSSNAGAYPGLDERHRSGRFTVYRVAGR
ncbi:MAG: hypothetical protein IT323_05915 [Anaerolineae bacterium]|nr:hypothetical protein [Anaerolineae bacterium]